MGAECVSWGQVSSPTLMRYHGNGSGNTLYSPANQAAATQYFNALAPWGAMGRVSLRPDGSVASRCNINNTAMQTGDNCYSDTDDTGGEQKMVYVPQFCFYCDYVAAHNIVWWVGRVGDAFTLQASDGTFTGATHTFSTSDIHPAFIVDSVAKTGVYVSAYEGSINTNYRGTGVTVLESKAGVAPGNTQTKTVFRGYAEALGTGWELLTTQMYAAIQQLFIVEFGSFYATGSIGAGVISGAIQNTGFTAIGGANPLGNATSSYVGGSVTPVSYRGIENIYGNCGTYTEGIRFDASPNIWIQPQTVLHTYSDSSTLTSQAYYVNSTDVLPATGSISNVFTTGGLGWGLFPSATSGAAYNTYICGTLTKGTLTVAYQGGYIAASPYLMSLNTSSGSASSALGSRIGYLVQ
jgi:hypothetical protein